MAIRYQSYDDEDDAAVAAALDGPRWHLDAAPTHRDGHGLLIRTPAVLVVFRPPFGGMTNTPNMRKCCRRRGAIPFSSGRVSINHRRLQSSSASRFTARAFGFLLLSQSCERPER